MRGVPIPILEYPRIIVYLVVNQHGAAELQWGTQRSGGGDKGDWATGCVSLQLSIPNWLNWRDVSRRKTGGIIILSRIGS